MLDVSCHFNPSLPCLPSPDLIERYAQLLAANGRLKIALEYLQMIPGELMDSATVCIPVDGIVTAAFQVDQLGACLQCVSVPFQECFCAHQQASEHLLMGRLYWFHLLTIHYSAVYAFLSTAIEPSAGVAVPKERQHRDVASIFHSTFARPLQASPARAWQC